MDNNHKRRYAHNLRLEDFGNEGQEKLLTSHLLIIGAGALGSSAAMYAAASGIGRLTIVDFDTIDISNLQRQVFFKESEAGKKKVEKIASMINSLNSDCTVTAIDSLLSLNNCRQFIGDADFIIDAADNPATTYLIESTCNELDKPYVTAGVASYHAQIMTHIPGSINFSEIFPRVSDNQDALPCMISGVFGPLTGLVSSIQASEAIKFLTGMPAANLLVDRLLAIDIKGLTFRTFPLK